MTLACLSVTIFAACKNDDDDGMMPVQGDQNFVTQAAQSNIAEIQAGQLAVSKGMSDSVKMFGQMMVNDHTMALHQLDSIVNDAIFPLPTQPDDAHKALLQRLGTLSGHSFDTAYINSQVKDHQVAIALFDTEKSSGTDNSLKAYATKTLPNLNMHLAMADTIAVHLH